MTSPNLRRFALPAIIFAATLLGGCGDATRTSRTGAITGDQQAAIDGFVADMMAKYLVPGVALAFIDQDGGVTVKGYGLRDGDLPVDGDTLFAIGSVSKSFTAAVAGTLVAEGRLAWERPIRDDLPGIRFHDDRATEEVTLTDLLSHRTGLPRHDLAWYGRDHVSRADLVAALRHLEPSRRPRELWQYNNFGYMLAGYLTGVAAGASWEDLISKRLLMPLGMVRTNLSVTAMAADPNSAKGYTLGTDGAVSVLPYRNIDAMGPAGSINSSARDMIAYLRMLLDDGLAGEQRVLPAGLVADLTMPRMVVPAARQTPDLGHLLYGLGWLVTEYRGHRYLGHGGAIDGFKSSVSWLPFAGTAVVVLTNAQHANISELIGMRVHDVLLGLAPIDWDRQTPSGVVQPAPPAPAAGPRPGPGRDPADYAGTYRHPGYGQVLIAAADQGRLTVTLNDLAPSETAWPVKGDVFSLTEVPDAGAAFTKLLFREDFDGNIAGISWPLEPGVAPVEFRK